jgi:hypothetical protein
MQSRITRGLWKPLLVTGALTPLMLSCVLPEDGLTVCLICVMISIIVFGIEHEKVGGGRPLLRQVLIGSALCVSLAFAGWVDVLTGFAIAVTVLYYIPIAIAAWQLSTVGLAIIVDLSIVTWLIAQMLTKDNIPTVVIIWNGIIMLISFAIIAILVRRERVHQERLAQLYDRLPERQPA